MGTFTAGGLRVSVDGGLRIEREGEHPKFVEEVEQVTYSNAHPRGGEQTVLYVTERCVFVLRPEGIELVEIAPGIDLQRDILDQMRFKPNISRSLRPMEARIFRPDLIKMRDELLKGQQFPP